MLYLDKKSYRHQRLSPTFLGKKHFHAPCSVPAQPNDESVLAISQKGGLHGLSAGFTIKRVGLSNTHRQQYLSFALSLFLFEKSMSSMQNELPVACAINVLRSLFTIVMTLACIIKLEMIIIDDPSLGLQPQLASTIMTVSDAPNCSIPYDCHYDDHNSFIIQATGDRITICRNNLLIKHPCTNKCTFQKKIMFFYLF